MAARGSSLRFHLTTVFVVLIAAIVGTIAYYTYFKNTDAVLELADKFIQQTSEATIQRTRDHLTPLAAAVKHLAALADSAPELARSERVFPTLMKIRDTYPQLQSVYFGFKDTGRFLQAFQIPPETEKYGPNQTKIPKGVHYVLRVLDWADDPKDTWRYLTSDGNVILEEDAFRMFYDVRKRNWFNTVLSRPHTLYWTNVVVFTSSQLPGIAPAFPIHDAAGNTVGAFAGWITKPVRQLVGEIGRIQEFDLSGDVKIRSGTSEIMALADSIRTMKTALQTFGKFVPKTLVREMVGTGQTVELGGQSRHLTIMFTDIQGFSTIAERSPTRELMLNLSDHFEAITSAVNENHGTIDKFIGDSVMAFWGAPVWDEDHVYQGCLSALMAKRRLDALNAAWEREGRPGFHVRFGLHTDAVLVGNIGATDRLSYTVLGDGVNVAARLEGVNKVYGTQIIASHSVYQEAGERCLFRPLDMVAVQGRRAGIIIYEILGTIGDGHADYQATDTQKRIAELSTTAFYAYLEKDWDKAIGLYTEILDLDDNERIATMFLNRCQEYRASPPPEDWSGVYTLKSK